MEHFDIGTIPLEEDLAQLEGAKYALVTPSGMTAIQTVLQTNLNPGDHVLLNKDMYSGTLKLLRTTYVDLGILFDQVDMADLSEVESSIRPETRIVFLESPSNPMMNVCNIEEITKITKKENPNILVVADNSIMTCDLQRPLDLGADIVLYSLTKYINGHQDIFMGSMLTNNQEIFENLRIARYWNGFIPSSWDCSMVQRGLKTLKIRMKKHASSAEKVVKFLKNGSYVEHINFVGFHRNQNVWARQMNDPNGMISFVLKGDGAFSKRVLENLEIIIIGESYAGCESLVCIPALMTHHSVPRNDRLKVGMTDNLIRLSVGLEDPQDLINDLKNAFSKASLSLGA